MHIGRIQGATRNLGTRQGFIGLPVRDEVMMTSQGSVHCTVSAWLPEISELTMLNRGASLLVKLMTKDHPPMMLEVGCVADSYSQRLQMQAELMACNVPQDIAALVGQRLMECGFKIVPAVNS